MRLNNNEVRLMFVILDKDGDQLFSNGFFSHGQAYASLLKHCRLHGESPVSYRIEEVLNKEGDVVELSHNDLESLRSELPDNDLLVFDFSKLTSGQSFSLVATLALWGYYSSLKPGIDFSEFLVELSKGVNSLAVDDDASKVLAQISCLPGPISKQFAHIFHALSATAFAELKRESLVSPDVN